MDKRKYILPPVAFLSGCCGLAYEVLYNRIFSNIFGDTFSVSFTILATFLTGIALGYLFAHRLKRWLFAVEAFIGIYSIALMMLILQSNSFVSDRFLYVFPLFPFSSVLYSFLFLITPSLLIGVSIPVLSRYMFLEKQDRPFDRTYFFYNAGAALTILAIEFILLRYLPVSRSVYVIGGINIIIGAVLFLMRDVYREEKVQKLSLNIIGAKKAAALFLFSAVSAAYQLLLLKLNSFVFGPFRENFSITVFTAIFFISLGTYFQSKKNISFKALLSAGIFSIVFELFFFKLSTFFLALVMGSVGEYAVISVLVKILWTALWGIPLLVTGMSIPALLKEFPSENIENTSGLLLFYSSAGNVFGYVIMFFLIHPLLPYGAMFAALIFLLVPAALALNALSKKTFLKAALLLALAYFFFWDEKMMFISHSNFLDAGSLLNEYHSIEKIEPFKAYNQTLAVVTKKGGKKTFFINGYHSIYLDNPIEKVVGVIPKLISPDAKNALVLGLGSGLTAGAASLVVRDVEVVEINAAVVKNQDRFSEYNNSVHRRKNARIFLDDGISYMKKTANKYDIIINTVTSPVYFSSSKLYTKDFFDIIKTRLSAGGVYYTWFDSRCGSQGARILLQTFLSCFKNAGIIGLRDSYYLLFASDAPFTLEKQKDLELVDFLTAVAGTNFKVDACILSLDIRTRETDRLLQGSPVNTIDHPVLEYTLARLGPDPSFFEIKKWLKEVTSSRTDPLTGTPWSEEDLERLYFQRSIYIPFLGLSAKYLLKEPQRLSLKRDFFYALQKADKKKIPHEFFRQYLENRFHAIYEKNRELLDRSPFPGKEIFLFDFQMKDQEQGASLKNALSLCMKDDKNAYYQAMAGISLAEMGNFSQGASFLKRAVLLDPGLLRLRVYLAGIYFYRLRDEQRARRLLYFFDTKNTTSDFDALEKVWLLNRSFEKPLVFLKNPWLKEGFFPEKDIKLDAVPPLPADYDFVFIDLLKYFYPKKP